MNAEKENELLPHKNKIRLIGNKNAMRHGHANGHNYSPTYHSWQAMLQRVRYPNRHNAERYSGRGIGVCKRWHIFDNFLADMGPRPAGKTLDRKDSEGIYCKSNCRWATPIEQANNTKRTRFISFNGKRQSVSMWARELGISVHTLFYRLRAGWSIAETLTRNRNNL